ncbi:MAG: tripartite tricarboxylate transporter substrate binding protein [Betaproteobacteria bacterium]|nr:MAG: tripartite tricarboxylate transporter substrate binding protein [Betaproteobacteria bacterium]
MMRMLRSLQAAAGLALAILAAPGFPQVSAPAYPGKPVRIIVPNAPSGLADICARLVAAKLGEALGQQFLVENRPGAGGTLGTAAAVKAAPDGYTLLAVFDSHATNPHLFGNLPYDTLADLSPISLLVRGPLVLVVRPGLGVASVGDFVRLAKSRPGAINFAVVGPGSPARLLMELFTLEAGIDVTMVSYKGAGLALGDLVGGEVDAMFATVPSVSSHLKAGRLRALAITSARRSAILPGVAALSETYAGFVSEAWVGLLAPAKTPPEIVARLNAEVAKILDLPDVKARFADQGLETAGGTPAQLDRWIRAELERWGKVIREQKITLE